MSTILITGGTGTLGKALIEKLYCPNKAIHIVSRDENRQKALKAKYPNVTCHVGDVCDRDDLHRIAHHRFNTIYHCAASKHIEICEDHISKCVKINYGGTKNVYHTLGRMADRFIFFTTDKAVYPVNAYGHAKALAEKYLQEPVVENAYIFRWGNILGSTGSAIPLFVDALTHGKPIYLTHPDMTRFWLTIESAVNFVLHSIHLKAGMHWPEFVKSATLLDVIDALSKILGVEPVIEEIGLRKGEKIHETMHIDERGAALTSQNCIKFRPDELIELLTPIVKGLTK